jgi:hydrogenase/urease accessory protein HupE
MRRPISLLAAMLLFSQCVLADEYRPAYLQLSEVQPGSFEALWKVPARGPRRLGLQLRFADDTELSGLRGQRVAGAYVEHFSVRRTPGLAGGVIAVDGLPATNTEVLLRIEYLGGVTETARLTPSSPSYSIAGSPARLDVIRTYLVFGTQHILQGFDHLLFVACLVFIAGSWRRIVLTVTGFTVAHSITLSMAALEIIGVPTPPIEATIALSIVFLAREVAIDRRDSLTWRYPVAVSSTFGLLHGFGFASALRDVGLPQNEIPAALLAFNAGVEIGQVMFVAMLLAVAALVVRLWQAVGAGVQIHGSIVRQSVAHGAGGIAMLWTLQRISAYWT